MPMAPRPNFAPARNKRRQPTGPQKRTPIVKTARRTGTRSSAQPQHIQLPSTPRALTSQPARTKWKRPQEDSKTEADELKGACTSEEPQKLSPQPRPVQLPSTSPAQRRRSLRLRGANPIQTTPDSVQQAKTPKRPREENEVSPPFPSLDSKRIRTTASASKPARWETIDEARVDFWRQKGIWPTEQQEKTMDRFRHLIHNTLPRTKSSTSLRRKRSDASINAETVTARTLSDQQSREQKNAPYNHPLYESQLKKCGSFMGKYEQGITQESDKLCRKLLETPQSPPMDSLFSDDMFEKTLEMVKDQNETRVVRDIAQLIVPSAELLAARGAEHLEPLRETTNAGWQNAIPICGSRPQPDYGLGFKQESFSAEQLQKLQPFIGDVLRHCSYFAATYNMYLPFLTCEVKSGAAALDVADRQNAHSQTIALSGLVKLFRLVGRENELHREINGFSISHSDEYVRIWGHYAVINGRDSTFYRHPIAKFDISKTVQGDNRWVAYTFVRNVYDLWLPNHFERICSAIDMLPADLNSEVSDQSELQLADQELASSRSGLSQRFEDHGLADEGAIPDSQPSVQRITPDTTIQSGSSNSKRKKG